MDPVGPVDPPVTPPRIGGVELIALALIVLTIINTWQFRHANNPDGVSYLDLAGRLLAGDGRSFVQGYWSPIYPALIALLTSVSGRAPVLLLEMAHLINGVAVIGTVVLLWWWGRRDGGPIFTRAALASLFLASYGLPRTEAVTPDLLLLALMAWLGYELLVERGTRWMTTGAVLGLIFLVKTSAWPWLLLSIPLRLWGARDAEGRRDVLRSLPVALGVMLLWIIPMSAKAGSPTLGSTGRLNYCWYIESCDSRTPDEHLGRHVAYREVAFDSTRNLVSAEFDADHWTYAPWSDPTAWSEGVITQRAGSRSADKLLGYWGRNAWRTVSLWLLPAIAGVLLPWALFEWRAERRRWWMNEGRPALVVALLGAAGIIQFILIHAEPRLLAPSWMLLSLGILYGGVRPAAGGTGGSPAMARRIAGWLGLLVVVVYGHERTVEGIEAGRQWDGMAEMIATARADTTDTRFSHERIVILGPAMPALGGAYLAGARITAQMPPSSVELFDRLPPGLQSLVLARLYGGKAGVAWRTALNGSITFVPIPQGDGPEAGHTQ